MSNPIHRGHCSDDVAWSTINAGEAIPGVVTPLTWSFFGDAVDGAMKLTFYDFGVLRRDQAVASPDPETRLWDVFYGRAAANLNTFRWLGDRMPGTSGDAIEEQIFGQVRPGVVSEQVVSRYPFVAARLPVSATLLIRRLKAACAPIGPFWRESVAPGAFGSAEDTDDVRRRRAQAVLRTAAAHFQLVMRPHTLAAMLCQAFYEQLRVASERAGRPGLELSLVTGYGDMAETDVVSDLWAVSRDALQLEEFIARHGYHGPAEGELSSSIWRIDPTPLHGLVEAYRAMDEGRDPRAVERNRAVERTRSEAELFAALSGAQRASAKLMARLAATFIPLRGVGKAAFLQSVDAARAGARALGELMVAHGELDDPADVFMFTLTELLEWTGSDLDTRAIAAERRAVHAEYQRLDVPDLFNGVPVPFPVADPAAGGGVGTIVTGTPVSPGVVDGIARLIVDQPGEDATLEPGEILVCRTTDPGWASVMMLASALVIDIGGPISHGAIVARELGIPCVIGTRDGTAQIRTGDRLRVDGARGEVEILSAATTSTATEVPETEPAVEESIEPIGEASMSEFLVLRALRLKGRANAAGLASATGLPESETASIAAALVESGDAREVRDFIMLMPQGRDRLTAMLDEERAGVDQSALHELYEEFVAVNGDFKQLASDWQMRDGAPNEHNDAAYDRSVIDRLPAIHERVSPVVARSVELAPRLAPYPGRFADALAKVQAGDTDWLLKPLIDSYHTVWFEYHEELIGLAGLSREAEAASGRAE